MTRAGRSGKQQAVFSESFRTDNAGRRHRRVAIASPKHSARDLLFSVAILFSLVGEVVAVLVGNSMLVVLFYLTTLLLGVATWYRDSA